MAQVLLIEDDPAVLEVLEAYLTAAGHQVLEARDGLSGIAMATGADLAIVDLMLPKMTGLEVIRWLGANLPELPVLILSALGSEEDRVLGLEVGADDYVAKPFSPREVVARVKALLRRQGQGRLNYGDLNIDPVARRVRLAGEEVALTKTEFDLLWLLLQHPGVVFSRERILARVWGTDFPGVDRVVDVHINSLRKKLGQEANSPGFIETVRGVGYRFCEEP